MRNWSWYHLSCHVSLSSQKFRVSVVTRVGVGGQWHWMGVNSVPATQSGACVARGWNGSTGELLQLSRTFTVSPGRQYLILAVSVAAADAARSAGVSWPLMGPPQPIEELLGLTSEGLSSRQITDSEAVRFRINRIDAPRA